MSLHSWGKYPKVENNVFRFDHQATLKNILQNQNTLIPHGNGRSYGDSALSKNLIHVKPYNYFLDFDSTTGQLHVQAGVLLSEILELFVPKGWFLKITPGTKLITVGGAIASDVHGKNHHIEGCFSECVEWFTLMLPSGDIVTCSKQKNTDLFRATCGGMGLTGVILDAQITLKKINSISITQTTIKTKSLTETFEAFDTYKNEPYSVAWIDCLATGQKMGRSHLMVGDFATDGNLTYSPPQKRNVPFNFPSPTLNTFSVKAFNTLYYHRITKPISQQKIDFDTFFYPLDAINNWNRIYGKNGFTQYQFILPLKTSFTGLEEILTTLSKSGKGSFLAVLKLYGPANNNLLSFPLKGYSLALDFKIEPGLFELLDKLDQIVVKHSGRIYLAKDVRVKKEIFEQGYPQIDTFRAIRKKYNMNEKLNSLQSQRVGI